MKRVFTIIVYIFAIIGFVLVSGYIAVNFGLTKTKGIIDGQHDYFKDQLDSTSTKSSLRDDSSVWIETEEWLVLKEAIKKDAKVIDRVANETGIPSRLIVTPLVVEQMRLFFSEREIFKQVFAPLKILGNQSQFSWGVMGIKQDTAKKIEENLKDSSSPWYLGADFEKTLDFTSEDPDKERFERLTNEDNRYYSYLYAAILLKQLNKQWKQAGFPIENKPGVIATLYNIGFNNSKPNSNPKLGGAEIEINKTTYSFGGLAQSFYDSGELSSEFTK